MWTLLGGLSRVVRTLKLARVAGEEEVEGQYQ